MFFFDMSMFPLVIAVSQDPYHFLMFLRNAYVLFTSQACCPRTKIVQHMCQLNSTIFDWQISLSWLWLKEFIPTSISCNEKDHLCRTIRPSLAMSILRYRCWDGIWILTCWPTVSRWRQAATKSSTNPGSFGHISRRLNGTGFWGPPKALLRPEKKSDVTSTIMKDQNGLPVELCCSTKQWNKRLREKCGEKMP